MDSRPSQSGRFGDSFSTNSPLSKSLSDASSHSQSLASILNNPHVGKSGVYGSDATWVGWWSSSSVVAPEFDASIPSNKPGSEIARSDFKPYLGLISEHYGRFEDIQNHANRESVDLEGVGGLGEALVACLREVPALYFKEDFELEDGATFRAACPFSTVAENRSLQENLSQYLDVVELHLVKEITLRSDSFFEAQGQLEDLNLKIVEGCSRIRELKETIRLLDSDLVDSACQIQDLNIARSNLLAMQQKLKLIIYTSQALSTLKMLVASADCAGALDVIDDLRHLLDGDELSGLHCFRHLRDHVAAAVDSANSILSNEFLHASIRGAGDMDTVILLETKEPSTLHENGEADEVSVVKLQEDAFYFRDRLLPLIIGLLRTAKLPAVLRVYRDTLTAEMKTAIKTVVADLLPVLVARPVESDFKAGERNVDMDGGGSSLASKLRTLSSDSFVQLLGSIFKIVRVHLVRAAEVKKAIEWIMSNLDGHYAADSVSAAIAHVSSAAELAQDGDDRVGSFLSTSLQKETKVTSLYSQRSDATSPSTVSKNFRADVLRENAEAVFAACDAAHGRWAKLLGVRALLHPRLRLQEFLLIYNISQDFIAATEKIGGRLGYSIRGILQSQAKAFVDFQHETRMTKIKAVLDQETWVEVDVPAEFQAIVATLFSSEHAIDESSGNDSRDNEASNNVVVFSTDTSLPAEDISRPSSTSQQHLNDQLVGCPDSSAHGSKKISDTKTKKEHGNSASLLLDFGGVGYHMVNCGLILLKMLSEYIDMNNSLPSLSSEIVHRVVEILKFFNTRTCQLVLGAGAMQVSGLKSITSKHLALASQVISFIHAVFPEIRRVLFLKVPDARKELLLSEIERVSQDYKVHRDEIHTKLVQIMRERLLVHLRGLPQIVETWNRQDDTDTQPSQFARSLTKEVGFLQRVLSRTMHEVDVQEIFREVVVIFHTQISVAFSQLEISTPQAKTRLQRDIQHILGCIRSLPSDQLNNSGTRNWGQLDELLVQRFSSAGE